MTLWCIKSNLPALTVIVRCSAVPFPHSASTCLSSLCRRLCPRLPSSYLTPPVLCRTTECPPPASPHPCRLVLPSLRPLTSLSSPPPQPPPGWRNWTRPAFVRPPLEAGTILTVNTLTTGHTSVHLSASQDKKHVVRMSRPLQRQNYKVIWAY